MVKYPPNIEVEKLFASSLGRRDQKLNIDLANKLAKSGDDKAIRAMLYYCASGTKVQKSDAIKVIYELARLRPDLFLLHIQTLVNMLEKANNRMIWGLLQALNALSEIAPEIMIKNIDQLLAASDRSSVIAKDNMMSILTKLAANPRFTSFLMPVILQRLSHSAPNQFPTYAEQTSLVIDKKDKNALHEIIKNRLKSIAQPAKQNRLNKILKNLE